jgi:hypothetical protein
MEGPFLVGADWVSAAHFLTSYWGLRKFCATSLDVALVAVLLKLRGNR